ncbi:MAG: hypothetical protein ACTSYI_11050 [Promethearchaeota archaeon]
MPKIYKLWILQRMSGLNLVDVTLDEFPTGNPIDGNLMSGLLTSFQMFSEEIMGEGMRLFETPNYRLIFSLSDDLVLVIMTDRAGSVKIAEKMLQRIQNGFVKRYRTQIDLAYRGDVTAFKEITKHIEEITQFKGIKMLREIARKEREHKNKMIQNSVNDLIHSMKK